MKALVLCQIKRVFCAVISAEMKESRGASVQNVRACMELKVIHSRFAVVFRRWKEMHVQSKDKHALRNVLKVGASNKAKKDSTAKTPKKKTTKVTKKKTTKVTTVSPTLSKSQCAMNRKRRIKILFEKKQRKKRKHDSQNNGLLL